MNQSMTTKEILSISLAIFCMLFGAGNLLYPITVGKNAGSLTTFGMIGFLITAILLPLTGLVGMILFDGNYTTFFNRLGKTTGSFLVFVCMLIIGPVIVMPRCITLSHTMIAPFIPIEFLQNITIYSSLAFCLLFLSATFITTYRASRIVSILGDVIAPILLASITFIIGKGIYTAHEPVPTTATPTAIFKAGFMMGYQTLDLLGTLFFASIIITILKKTTHKKDDLHNLALNGLKAGIIGLSLLGLVYIGMSILGAFHSHDFINIDAGATFRLISFSLLGSVGAAIISVSVFLACLSTVIGLSAVVAEYTKNVIFAGTITYVQSLLFVLITSIPLSIFGLSYVLAMAGGPIVFVGYPVLITLTLCNIAYKICNFGYVKTPVAVTFVLALASYFFTL